VKARELSKDNDPERDSLVIVAIDFMNVLTLQKQR